MKVERHKISELKQSRKPGLYAVNQAGANALKLDTGRRGTKHILDREVVRGRYQHDLAVAVVER
jgi:hypothetical protein